MYELPPVNFSSSTSSRITVMPRIGVLVLIWLLLLGGYGAYRVLYQSTRSTEKKTDGITRTFPAFPGEWGAHVGSLSAAAFDSEANLRQAETELRRTLALTDSFVEARHLHAALASLEASHQDLVRSRHDIEALEVLLKGEKLQ